MLIFVTLLVSQADFWNHDFKFFHLQLHRPMEAGVFRFVCLLSLYDIIKCMQGYKVQEILLFGCGGDTQENIKFLIK